MMETFEEYEARTAGMVTIGQWEKDSGGAPLPPAWEPEFPGDDGWGPVAGEFGYNRDGTARTGRPAPDIPPPASGPPVPCLDSLGRPIPWMGDWVPAFRRESGQ